MVIPLRKGYTMPKPDTSDKNGGEIDARRPWQRMQEQIAGIAKLDDEMGGGFEIAQRVTDEMLSVDTDDIDEFIDAVLAAGNSGPTKAENMLHKPFIPTKLSWHKSAEKFSQGGFGVYVICDYRNPVTMEDAIFSTGAPNIVTALFTFWQKGVFDLPNVPAFVIRDKDTGNGTMYYLERA